MGVSPCRLQYASLKEQGHLGSSLVVQWLGLCALSAEGPGSIPAQGTKVPQLGGAVGGKNNRASYITTCHVLSPLIK